MEAADAINARKLISQSANDSGVGFEPGAAMFEFHGRFLAVKPDPCLQKGAVFDRAPAGTDEPDIGCRNTDEATRDP